MSFSTDIKEELSKISNLANKPNVRAEFIGYLLTGNIVINKITKKRVEIKYSTENEYNINRFAKLLNNLNINDYKISIQGKVFIIVFYLIEFDFSEIIISNNLKIVINSTNKVEDFDEGIKKAIVRGAFLGSGSITNPEKTYHLEIIFSSEENAKYVKKLLEEFQIFSKELKKSDEYSLYFKDGEEISKFLAFIGASSAMLKFEDIRVVREMRNNVNRLVNCETANLNKTVNAAVKQIDDIKIIKKKNKFGELPNNLKELAELRLENPDASLVELGKMLKNPVGKSGVNYRFKVISKIAEELK